VWVYHSGGANLRGNFFWGFGGVLIRKTSAPYACRVFQLPPSITAWESQRWVAYHWSVPCHELFNLLPMNRGFVVKCFLSHVLWWFQVVITGALDYSQSWCLSDLDTLDADLDCTEMFLLILFHSLLWIFLWLRSCVREQVARVQLPSPGPLLRPYFQLWKQGD